MRHCFFGFGLLTLLGCQFIEPHQEFSEKAQEDVYSSASTLERKGVERPQEQAFEDISKSFPSFAGFHYTEDGDILILSTDKSAPAELTAMIRDITVNRTHSVRFKKSKTDRKYIHSQVEYTFSQLKQWRDTLFFSVLDIQGVNFLDLDEQRNRVSVGISRIETENEIKEILNKEGIPHKGIFFRYESFGTPAATVRDKIRPIPGGVQIAFNTSACTVAFPVFFQDTWVAALSNSHCSTTMFGLDSTSYYQNLTTPSSNYFGTEFKDPPSWSCGALWLWNCRNSDVNIINVDSLLDMYSPRVARTESWNGSIDIDSNFPHFQVKGESTSVYVNDLLEKVGRTTGWTYGPVTETCVDVNQSGSWARLLCQDRVNFNISPQPGDSGSPVFYWEGTSDAYAAGVLWSVQGTFSSMGQLRLDLGNDFQLVF